MKTLREHLESAHDELVAARKIAALSKHDSYTDIGDAIECVEAALVWGGGEKQDRLVQVRTKSPYGEWLGDTVPEDDAIEWVRAMSEKHPSTYVFDYVPVDNPQTRI